MNGECVSYGFGTETFTASAYFLLPLLLLLRVIPGNILICPLFTHCQSIKQWKRQSGAANVKRGPSELLMAHLGRMDGTLGNFLLLFPSDCRSAIRNEPIDPRCIVCKYASEIYTTIIVGESKYRNKSKQVSVWVVWVGLSYPQPCYGQMKSIHKVSTF